MQQRKVLLELFCLAQKLQVQHLYGPHKRAREWCPSGLGPSQQQEQEQQEQHQQQQQHQQQHQQPTEFHCQSQATQKMSAIAYTPIGDPHR